MKNFNKILTGGLILFATMGLQADQVILDDLIVDGSNCVGQDCVNGESFGFDTIRLKENNLRIKFQDTSTTSSFPTRDWQLTANDSSNGGANKFSIDDIDGGRTPFTIEAGAPSHSLYVDDGGRLGLGTSTPVVDVHTKSGNTPTLRLEQDGSSGFTAQTWDLAGNETNFFIRDASNGSTLPFRIKPGAPSNSIYIAADGDIGLGTDSPNSQLHINEATGDTAVKMVLKNSANNTSWEFVHRAHVDEGLAINNPGNVGAEFIFSQTGDLTAQGNVIADSFIAGGTTLNVPDYVFENDYDLMPIAELAEYILNEKHLPEIAPAAEINKNGVNLSEFQMQLLKKVEELTLYTLQQDQQIRELTNDLQTLRKANYETVN